jgi:Inhibitor of vertebrate lysozyme (Ivy)
MQRQLRWVLVMMCAISSPVIAADPNLSDVIKKPAYARTLRSLLDHAGNLPSWTRDVLKPKGDNVEAPATHAAINGTAYEVYFSCESQNCSNSKLALMFASNGTQAWGELFNEGTISYLGAPSEAQQAVLKKAMEFIP